MKSASVDLLPDGMDCCIYILERVIPPVMMCMAGIA
jgi:hypothetical protein